MEECPIAQWGRSEGLWNTLIPLHRKGGGQSIHSRMNVSLVGQSWKLWNFPGRGDDEVNPGEVRAKDLRYSMWPCNGSRLRGFTLPTFANRIKAPLSDGSVVLSKNTTRQSMFPNKSLQLSAHNHTNNIYLMAHRPTQGVGLLRGQLPPHKNVVNTVT